MTKHLGLRGLAATLMLTMGSMAQAQQPAAGQPPAPAQAARPANAGIDDTRAASVLSGADMPGPIDNLQDVQDSLRMAFMVADTNHDGQISQQEATNAGNLLVGGIFFRADENGDGKVTKEEMQKVRDDLYRQQPYLRFLVERSKASAEKRQGESPTPVRDLGNLIDANNDQAIQATEVRQIVQTTTQGLFAAADTNRDNQLTPAELNAAAVGMARTAAQAAFQQADADNNGSISRDEFVKAMTKPSGTVFDILDANFDGQLTQQELDRAQRVIASLAQRLVLPEPPNSLRNAMRNPRGAAEAAPVPNFGTPAQPGAAPAPAQPPR